jgi:outer membrane protein assembly factor BamD (BamD/ComL family)
MLPAALFLALLPAPMQAARERKSYQVDGKVLQSDGKPFTGGAPVVFLQGAITPFSRQTLAGRDGKFRFKNVPAGTYTLSVAVPRIGEFRRTVEVGPSVADAKGIVTVLMEYGQATPVDRGGGVSAAELSVSDDAIEEYKEAQQFLSRGDHARAAERLRKAVDISPQFATAWNQLGTIAYQTRQYPQAEEYFRESLKQDPEAYAPLVNLGGALLALNRFEESLEVNRAAVKARPGDALAHSQLGKSYFYLGRLDDAETHLKRAKALDAGHFSYPQVFLIEIYARKNQLPASIAEMEEFLRLHPDSDWAPKIRELLGVARSRIQAPR